MSALLYKNIIAGVPAIPGVAPTPPTGGTTGTPATPPSPPYCIDVVERQPIFGGTAFGPPDPVTGERIIVWSIIGYRDVVTHKCFPGSPGSPGTPATPPIPGTPRTPGTPGSPANYLLGWTGGASTGHLITGNCAFTFSASYAVTDIVAGLNTNDTSTSYLEIGRGFRLIGGTYAVIEFGQERTTRLARTSGFDVFVVAQAGPQTVYIVNDVIVYRSTKLSDSPVCGDVSIFAGGEGISGVTFSATVPVALLGSAATNYGVLPSNAGAGNYDFAREGVLSELAGFAADSGDAYQSEGYLAGVSTENWVDSILTGLAGSFSLSDIPVRNDGVLYGPANFNEREIALLPSLQGYAEGNYAMPLYGLNAGILYPSLQGSANAQGGTVGGSNAKLPRLVGFATNRTDAFQYLSDLSVWHDGFILADHVTNLGALRNIVGVASDVAPGDLAGHPRPEGNFTQHWSMTDAVYLVRNMASDFAAHSGMSIDVSVGKTTSGTMASQWTMRVPVQVTKSLPAAFVQVPSMMVAASVVRPVSARFRGNWGASCEVVRYVRPSVAFRWNPTMRVNDRIRRKPVVAEHEITVHSPA